MPDCRMHSAAGEGLGTLTPPAQPPPVVDVRPQVVPLKAGPPASIVAVAVQPPPSGKGVTAIPSPPPVLIELERVTHPPSTGARSIWPTTLSVHVDDVAPALMLNVAQLGGLAAQEHAQLAGPNGPSCTLADDPNPLAHAVAGSRA